MDARFLPVQSCRKTRFLPETACPRSGVHHDSRRAVGFGFVSCFHLRRRYLLFFLARSLEENLRNPVKTLQLCGERHQKLKSPVFSIFGRGILEMMKGFSSGERPRTDVLAGPGPEGVLLGARSLVNP